MECYRHAIAEAGSGTPAPACQCLGRGGDADVIRGPSRSSISAIAVPTIIVISGQEMTHRHRHRRERVPLRDGWGNVIVGLGLQLECWRGEVLLMRAAARRCSTFTALVPVLLLSAACSVGEAAAVPRTTNATMTFHVLGTTAALERSVVACLVVAKPDEQPVQNGGDLAAAVDGRREFPAGTRATDIVGYYAELLLRHGWTPNQDFLAAGNALHFYGISQLGGGSADPRLRVNGATDSDSVPYRDVPPAPR